jgi:hypothetical protein
METQIIGHEFETITLSLREQRSTYQDRYLLRCSCGFNVMVKLQRQIAEEKEAHLKFVMNALEAIHIPREQGYKCGCFFELERHKDDNGNTTYYPMFFKTIEELVEHRRIVHGAIKSV